MDFIKIKNADLIIHRKADITIPKELCIPIGTKHIVNFEGKNYYISNIKTSQAGKSNTKFKVEIWETDESEVKS